MHGKIIPCVILHTSANCESRFNLHLLALSLALLQVFLEGRSSGNGLAGVLIYVDIGVAGIGHASLSNLLVDGSGADDRGGGGECRGGGHEGGENGKLVLSSVHKEETNRRSE
jgi:hypothetical protein